MSKKVVWIGLEPWRWIVGITIILMGMALNFVEPQDKKQEKAKPPVVKIDSTKYKRKIPYEQAVMKQQMYIQQSKLDSLIKKKKKDE